MEKIWLKSYPQDVPAEINPDAYQSLVELLLTSCQQHANKPAFYNLGATLTYQDFERLSGHFAAYLQQELKIKKADRVAIMLPNLLQYPVALLGIMRAGGIVVNVNPLYTADELVRQINDSGAVMIITIANFANTVEKALPRMASIKHVMITDVGDLFPRVKAWLIHFVLKYIYKQIPNWNIANAVFFRDALQKGETLTLTPVTITNQDTAFLQYTGGTTGVSKGAVLTHRNIIANIMQAQAWFKSILSSDNQIIITALPLYHIFSLTANCLFFSMTGGLNVLITNPRDIRHMIKDMKRFNFTAITAVNTLFNALVKHKEFAKLDFSHLLLSLGGGMAVQQAVAEKWHEVTGVLVLEAYGLTETSPCVTINPPYLKTFNHSIGLPVPSTDVCILDEEGHELPIDTAGELAVKGPQVMKEYWNNPKETQKVFNKEGWLLTGDIASIDAQGFVRILERKKDMILVSGFNVYPNEIEDVLAKLPGVKEVAVVSMNDENSGEVPKAFIVKDNPALTSEQVIQYCRQHLTAYKVPKQVEFLPDLPKSNVGKILRRVLRTEYT